MSAQSIQKQVKLPLELSRRLNREARRQRRPVSLVVADAVRRELEQVEPAPARRPRNNGR